MNATLIPFAYPCMACLHACICPACGMHVETWERKDFESYSKVEYSRHWAEQHEGRVEIANLTRADGRRYLGVVDVTRADGVGQLVGEAYQQAPDGCPAAHR